MVMTEGRTVQKSKRKYSKPSLVGYGSITALTQTGSSLDGGGGGGGGAECPPETPICVIVDL
jgi:hypothetical protein